MKEIIIKDLEQIGFVAKKFLEYVDENRVFAFEGSMGAGKTTFIKAICEELEVEDDVCSPTFAILNVYYSERNGEVFHFDFYRLVSEEQALDIGVEENFYSGSWCFIEWAENVTNLLPPNCIKVKIEQIEDNQRKVTIYL